jgi:cytidylate kinase
LDARVEERARRRARQGGEGCGPLAQVLAGIVERDRIDSTRSVAPLAQAADALRIETDDLSVAQVVDRILASVRSRLRSSG